MQSYTDRLILSQADILERHGRLRDLLAQFIKFGHSEIYFPPDEASAQLQLLAEEKRLLLPLRLDGKFLGMIALEEAGLREIRKIIHILPQITAQCLSSLALERALCHDSRTGLFSEEALFLKIRNEVDSLRELLKDPTQSSLPLHRICFGMIVIVWYDARHVAQKYDYDFCWRIFTGLAKNLGEILPEGVIAAPLGYFEGRYEFGLLFPATGRNACQRLAQSMLEKLESRIWHDEPSQSSLKVRLHAGHALYPQDMKGEELRLPVLEQAFRLRDRARYAARIAASLHSNEMADRILSFTGILRKGGRILEILEPGKVRVNLGQAANAREGMRFNVLAENGEPPSGLGQIVLLETGIKNSIAEILYLTDSTRLPVSGDCLALMDSSTGAENDEFWKSGNIPDPTSDGRFKIHTHAEFISFFAAASSQLRNFALGISSIVGGAQNQAETMADFYDQLDCMLSEKASGEGMQLAGRYGSNGFIFFHSSGTVETITSFYRKVHNLAKSCGLDMASGLFIYPCLNFGRSESEACALKALEYARLLPEPHIGILDSLALNISADKRYSLGDAFGAIEEYKLALLADPANAMARNSLGVCMAAMGKMEDAKKMFEKALADCTEDGLKSKICYNLGTVYQKQAELRRARNFYRRCLQLDENHIFAWIRLGQISEIKGRKANARQFYEKALNLGGENDELANVALRNLARLEAMGKNPDNARAMLHDALLRNPGDTASLTLLAQIYLDKGGDPVVAETLARRSANLDGSADAWSALGRALEAQGRHEEAMAAQARAGNC